jgi:hypothetical protein
MGKKSFVLVVVKVVMSSLSAIQADLRMFVERVSTTILLEEMLVS